MELKKYKLGELLCRIENGAVVKQNKGATGIPITRIETLSKGVFNRDKLGYADIDDPTQYENYILEDNDLLMSHINSKEFVGRTVIYKKQGNECIIHGMNLLRIKTNARLLDSEFAYYFFQTDTIKRYLYNLRKDAIGQSSIAISDIKNMIVSVPNISVQKEIAFALRSYDCKIALNRAINQNLEKMAKQLYDYWFVQFDFPNEEGKPYKSSGGAMVWNEKLKREFPEGWNTSLIKEIAATYSGGTPKSTNIEYYNNGEIAWINSGELNSPIITKTTNYITKCGLENSSAKLYPSNSILIAMYGATAGKVSLLTFEACSNQAVCGVIPTMENMLYYVYFHISSLYNHFITLSTGSARDNISQETIKNILLPIPNRNILKLFDEKIGSIYQMIINNCQQIDSLTKQRDELLPLLMNGQISPLNCD